MGHLLAAEWRKLRTTRTMWWLLGISLGLIVLTVVATIAVAGSDESVFGVDTVEGVRNVFAQAGSGSAALLVLGIIGVTGEYRHGTITSTFLVTPRRGRVVVAKLVSYFLVGVAFSIVSIAVTVAIAIPWLNGKGVDLSSVDSDILLVLVGVVVAGGLWALMGVGVGALVRNQVAAIVVALIWVLLVEGIVTALFPKVGRWLPGSAAAALQNVARPNIGLLTWWAGGLLFAAYALAFAAVGSRFAMSRDVT